MTQDPAAVRRQIESAIDDRFDGGLIHSCIYSIEYSIVRAIMEALSPIGESASTFSKRTISKTHFLQLEEHYLQNREHFL